MACAYILNSKPWERLLCGVRDPWPHFPQLLPFLWEVDGISRLRLLTLFLKQCTARPVGLLLE